MKNWVSKGLFVVQLPETQSVVFFVTTVVLSVGFHVYWDGPLKGSLILLAVGLFLTRLIAMGKYFPSPANHRSLHNVIITGANTGIGKETARQLMEWGAHVIIACRNQDKGRAAAADLIRTCTLTDPHQRVSVMPLDLSSLQSVEAFVEAWKSRRDSSIDVLINNAGVMMCPYTLSADGMELQFATNHVGHFHLTRGLLPFFRANGRIVNVSSAAHIGAPPSPLPWNQLEDRSKYDPVKAYAISKIANIYFTSELHRRLPKLRPDVPLFVYSLHPGTVQSELVRHLPAFALYFVNMVRHLFMKTTLQGAQTSLYCAAHQPDPPSGAFFWDCQSGSPSVQAQDHTEAKRLWVNTEERIANWKQQRRGTPTNSP